MEKDRCPWPKSDPLMIEYHDREWGIPLHNDQKWFEFIVLDTFQAGLSWKTVLHKRENFRKAFDNFDYNKVSAYDEIKVNELLSNAGIIRNRMKILAAISNAKAFLEARNEYGSFDNYIWKFTGGRTITNNLNDTTEVPVTSPESDLMSKELKKRGFKFVGSTTCYAFMQAGGMVNDHLTRCFRYKEIKNSGATLQGDASG